MSEIINLRTGQIQEASADDIIAFVEKLHELSEPDPCTQCGTKILGFERIMAPEGEYHIECWDLLNRVYELDGESPELQHAYCERCLDGILSSDVSRRDEDGSWYHDNCWREEHGEDSFVDDDATDRLLKEFYLKGTACAYCNNGFENGDAIYKTKNEMSFHVSCWGFMVSYLEQTANADAIEEARIASYSEYGKQDYETCYVCERCSDAIVGTAASDSINWYHPECFEIVNREVTDKSYGEGYDHGYADAQNTLSESYERGYNDAMSIMSISGYKPRTSVGEHLLGLYEAWEELGTDWYKKDETSLGYVKAAVLGTGKGIVQAAAGYVVTYGTLALAATVLGRLTKRH